MLGCAVILLLLTAFYFLRVESGASPVQSEKIKRGPIENTINTIGTLEPLRYVEVGAQVSGQVRKIHCLEGDDVTEGQLLVEVDATVFETRVQNSEASLEGNRAQLQQLQAELELAELRAKRNKGLYSKKAVSEDTLFESLANERILRARIRAMKAQIKADEASLAGDKATLGYAKIYAPIGGTVVSVSVREGQTLNANQNAPLLLKIADLGVLTLRAEVSEADINRLRKGMPVYFKTFGSRQRRWYSRVRQILPTPSIVNDVVLYQVLIDVDNKDGVLMDAMTAQVYFVRNSAEDALILPLGAVRSGDNGSEVLRKGTSGFETVLVDIGVRNRTHAQVLSGLNLDDEVIVGNYGRRPRGQNTSLLGGQQRGGGRGF
ncbi:MAG: efflux RND transporter periplasmic adaptor subunit [Gammaproteobacteria bacterium]|nr:efflux RND transporter periplasmic adaptor subunit [Gammaproteobacteria bacterium]